jgi:hypothetical protein
MPWFMEKRQSIFTHFTSTHMAGWENDIRAFLKGHVAFRVGHLEADGDIKKCFALTSRAGYVGRIHDDEGKFQPKTL